jgi:hypothetical protein
MTKFHKISSALTAALILQGCLFAQTVEEETIVYDQTSIAASTPLPTRTPVPPATQALSTPTAVSSVTITAVKGNLYIRRGPGTPYNQIGVLYKGMSARVIGRDVLSRWAQIQIPGSEKTGWVSIMTDFTRVDGDLDSVPDFTFKDWPLPAYLKNCTEHDLWIEPGNYYLYSLWTNDKYLNEVQVDPGVYAVYDLFVEGLPKVQDVQIREGMTVYLTLNGLDVNHKCP